MSETPRMDEACARAMATEKPGNDFALELADQYRITGRDLETRLRQAEADLARARTVIKAARSVAKLSDDLRDALDAYDAEASHD